MQYELLTRVGRTPLVQIYLSDIKGIKLYSKLEFMNPTGSVKDRAADYVLSKLLKKKEINQDTIIVESSSGNFGVALASFCKKYGLKFYCVIDPCITKANEMIIRNLSTKTFKVNRQDENGGYLLERLAKVQEIIRKNKNAYWVNQYANPYNAEAYEISLGKEICDEMDDVDYVFLGVSSGGTITGISNAIKKQFPKATIVAVDVEGSVIFGKEPKKRHIPGIGSSIVPDILKRALIDEVVYVNEIETIEMCNKLLKEQLIFAGGSSGSVLAAIKKYFGKKQLDYVPSVVTIFPDRGERYTNTVYDEEWRLSINNKGGNES